MTLKETLIKIKKENSEESFNAILETMRRKASKGLIEGVSVKNLNETLKEIEDESKQNSSYFTLTEKEELISLISEISFACDNLTFLENYDSSKEEKLNEAVTYINNNGELKTKTAAEYVADMHVYKKPQIIETYDEKKLKKHEYNLVSEDLDSFKKLSDMTLEEILAESEK